MKHPFNALIHRQKNSLLFYYTLVGALLLQSFCLAADTAAILAPILPADTLFYARLASTPQADFNATALGKLSNERRIQAFLNNRTFERDAWIADAAKGANIDPELLRILVTSPKEVAVINIVRAADGTPQPTIAISVQIPSALTQEMIFSALKSAVQTARSYGYGADAAGAEMMREVAWEENLPGGRKVLVVPSRPALRATVLGNMLLLVISPSSEDMISLVRNFESPLGAQLLTQNPAFLTAAQAVEAKVTSNYAYCNIGQVYDILNILRFPQVSHLLDALGLGATQAMAVSGTAVGEGFLHRIFFLTPGERQGLMSALIAQNNADRAAVALSSDTPWMLSARLNLQTLYRVYPQLLSAISEFLPVSVRSSLLSFQGYSTVLGVPIDEILATLGDALALQSGSAGTALRFQMVNLAKFQDCIRRMEMDIGMPMNERRIGQNEQYLLRYAPRTGSGLPLAPSYCIVGVYPKGPFEGYGSVMIATHPQVLEAILSRPDATPLGNTADFRRVVAGLGTNYAAFYYTDNVFNLAMLYDSIMPLLYTLRDNTNPYFQADPGLLPPGADIEPYLFGLGVGVRYHENGIELASFSPFGIWGLALGALDRLTMGHPVLIQIAIQEAWIRLGLSQMLPFETQKQ